MNRSVSDNTDNTNTQIDDESLIIDSYIGPRTSLDSDVGRMTPQAPTSEYPVTPVQAPSLLEQIDNAPRMLRRTRAMNDLFSTDNIEDDSEFARFNREDDSEFVPRGDSAQPRTIRYDDDDNISYMSFSTDNEEDDTNSVYAGQESSDISDYEEDSDDYSDISSNTDSIVQEKTSILSRCLNDSPITLMSYEDSDLNGLFMIHVPNMEGKFTKGSCLTREEMKGLLNSDLTTFPPNYIMSIYTTPSSGRPDDLITGLTGKPTGKIVVRMPTNQIYITFGSLKRVLTTSTIKWYALPLYGGKPRRLGNVGGIYGASMNHGQVPGFQIYKLFTEHEIKNNVVATEDSTDFPHTYQYDTMKSIFDLIGNMPINAFISNIINELVEARRPVNRFIPPRISSLGNNIRERRYGNPPDI